MEDKMGDKMGSDKPADVNVTTRITLGGPMWEFFASRFHASFWGLWGEQVVWLLLSCFRRRRGGSMAVGLALDAWASSGGVFTCLRWWLWWWLYARGRDMCAFPAQNGGFGYVFGWVFLYLYLVRSGVYM